MKYEEIYVLFNARKQLGLTQQQVADNASVTLRAYQRFESGERKISNSSLRTAVKILEVLKIDVAIFSKELQVHKGFGI